MPTNPEIDAAANTLRAGGLVAFPTETVYGLGANALDAEAVAKIFELKGRPKFDPLIVHIAEPGSLAQVAQRIPDRAADLMDRFWPGPLSLVLEKRPCVPDIVTAGLKSVAVRCPDHDVARQLIRAAGVPISAPSANRFGMVSPTTAAHVRDQFSAQLPHVLDDGPCRIGVESTVVSFVDLEDAEPVLLRHGGITQEEIEKHIGPIRTHTHQEVSPMAPGQLSRHYSPRTPLVLADECPVSQNTLAQHIAEGSKCGLLQFSGETVRESASEPVSDRFRAVEVLAKDGSLRQAAVNLFAALRRLDDLELDLIIAEPVPERELGRAIMDRLRRAAER